MKGLEIKKYLKFRARVILKQTHFKPEVCQKFMTHVKRKYGVWPTAATVTF